MSGWPSAARGGVQALAAGLAAAGLPDCALTGITRHTRATATARAPSSLIDRRFMWPSILYLVKVRLKPDATSDLWLRRRLGRGGPSLFHALAAERAAHRLVAFVARVFVDLILRALQKHHHRPWLRVDLRVGDGDFVLERVGAIPREPLDDVGTRAEAAGADGARRPEL